MQLRGIHDETVEGVAHTDTSCLGIADNRCCHVDVGISVKIGVHHTGTSLDDRHLGGVAHEGDEAFAATWDTKVDVAHSRQHLASCLMCGGQQLYRFLQTVFAQHVLNQCHACAVAVVGILATFQHTGIAGLEAQ